VVIENRKGMMALLHVRSGGVRTSPLKTQAAPSPDIVVRVLERSLLLSWERELREWFWKKQIGLKVFGD
jgi:hypothetical protein